MTTIAVTEKQMRALELSRLAVDALVKMLFSDLARDKHQEGPFIQWGHVDVTSGGDQGAHGYVGQDAHIRGRVRIGTHCAEVTTLTCFEDGSGNTDAIFVTLVCPTLGDRGRTGRRSYRCEEGGLPVLKKVV